VGGEREIWGRCTLCTRGAEMAPSVAESVKASGAFPSPVLSSAVEPDSLSAGTPSSLALPCGSLHLPINLVGPSVSPGLSVLVDPLPSCLWVRVTTPLCAQVSEYIRIRGTHGLGWASARPPPPLVGAAARWALAVRPWRGSRPLRSRRQCCTAGACVQPPLLARRGAVVRLRGAPRATAGVLVPLVLCEGVVVMLP
jgi:hypothetical protein